MINAKTIPLSVNADNDARVLEPTEVLNIENMRIGVSEDGKNLQIRNFPSTQLVYSVNIPYNNVCIGTAKDLSRQRLFGLIWNDYGLHTIYAYDLPSNTTYIVLLSSQTEQGFNWDVNNRIDKNARVIGNWLIFGGDLNEPVFIDIEAGIKLNQPSYVTDIEPYVTPIPYTTYTLIVRPPIYRLQVAKFTDAGFVNNFTQNNSYQFYYRYWYKDYRFSVLSIFSQLMPANGIEETDNAISVYMPFGEDIPAEVQQVDICVRYGNAGKTFLIKSYNKNNYYDALAIEAHNANAVQLGLVFYDNTSGIAIDDITANTSFDDIGLQIISLESARNRLFLASPLKGYDSPSITSLAVALGQYNTGGAGTYTAQWKYFYLTWRNTMSGITGQVQYHYAYSSVLNPGVYFYDAYKTTPSPPPTLNSDDATTTWTTENELAAWVQRNYAPPSGTVWIGAPFVFTNTGATTDIIFTVDLNGLQFFKSASIYKVTTTFYDRYRRKCGVVSRSVEITVPERTFSQSVFSTNMLWTLSNGNAAIEIPDWAYYYTIDITKNLTTRFFVQIEATTSFYTTKDEDGTFHNDNPSFSENVTYATSFDLKPLIANGMGYTFTEGDYCRVHKNDDTNVLLRVLGTSGSFVLCTPIDFGTLGAGAEFIIELYTPYRPSVTEPYFETGDMLPIDNPTTSNRQYAVTSGAINGDCYAIERDAGGSDFYFVEAMSPNDKVWQIWDMDRGWVNFIDTIGQQNKTTNIDWSDVYINGTKVNGLNKFQALNTKDVGNSSGSIQKIQLTNKQTEDGTVMLVLTEEDHLSAYLQEVQLVASSINNSIVQTEEVIGTINALKNGRGTINGESVEEYQGNVWGVSILQGVIWQYSNDGVNDITDNGVNRMFDRYCKKYIANQYNRFTNPIHSVYDPSSDEMLFSLPAVEDVSFPPVLPSYDNVVPDYASSIQNRFDIYDGQAKILIYKTLQNKWTGAYQYSSDCMSNLGDKLYGFKIGNLHLHNEDFTSFNTIYGVQYPQRICFPVNIGNPSAIKDVLNILLEGNGNVPNYTVLYSEYPFVQITDLANTDTNADGSPKWENKEGVVSASFFRDRLSPNISGTAVQKMLEGDIINSATPLVMVEFQVYDSQLILNFINVGVLLSRGHNYILNEKKK